MKSLIGQMSDFGSTVVMSDVKIYVLLAPERYLSGLQYTAISGLSMDH